MKAGRCGGSTVLGAGFIAWMSLLSIPALGEVWPAGILTQMQKKLTAFDGVATDGFGASVSAWGDVVAVGVPAHNGYNGAVYVFLRNAGGANAWGLVRKITVSDASGGNFGGSVAVCGDVLVAGAKMDAVGGNLDQGSAYVFERHAGGPEAWGQVRKLVAPDAAREDQFGSSVAVAGDVIAVGAPRKDYEQGAAYVFHRGTAAGGAWTQSVKVAASDGATSDLFGWAVSLADGFLAVGAPGDDSRRGSAYIFERSGGGPDTWWQAGKVTASDRAGNDSFGISLSMSGYALAVGAHGDDSYRGAAYVFEREADRTPAVGDTNRWIQAARLTASDRTTNGYFGAAVALQGGTLLCGAWGDEGGFLQRGAAYVFERFAGGFHAWGQTIKITVADGVSYDRFGNAVALSGGLLAVGCNWDDDRGTASGSVYLFPKLIRTWNPPARVTAPDIAASQFYGSECCLSDNGLLAVRGPGVVTGSHRGVIDLFERDLTNRLWRQIARIVDTATNSMGYSLAIAGDVLAAGAIQEKGSGSNEFQGAAYVYERNAGGAGRWGQVARLADADGEAYDNFGYSVAVDGDVLVVGVYGDTQPGRSQAGSARLYERHQGGTNAWGLAKVLSTAAGGAFDQFGASVDVSGDVVAIGAPRYPIEWMPEAGAVFVYERNAGGANTWGDVKMLSSPLPDPDGLFGASISLQGDMLAVGAPGSGGFGGWPRRGVVHVFERNRGGTNAWGHMITLLADDVVGEAYFGNPVEVSGDLILVGSDAYYNHGAVHIYSRHSGGTNAFGRIARFKSPYSYTGGHFGQSLSAIDGTIAIGSEFDSLGPGQPQSGAVYVYEGLCYATPQLMLDTNRPPRTGFHSVLNNRYDLERTTNLSDPDSWVPVPGQSNLLGTGQTQWMTDSDPSFRRFHRLKERKP